MTDEHPPAPTAADLEHAASIIESIPDCGPKEPWTAGQLYSHASHLRELEEARGRKLTALAELIDSNNNATALGLAQVLDAAGWIVDAIPTGAR